MCNLYSLTKGQQAILQLSRAMRDATANLPPLPGIFPDYPAPIVRTASDGVRELALVRWGMPSSKKALLDAATRCADKQRAKDQEVVFDDLVKMEPDSGTTNVRNTSSTHWKRWLEPANRCLVPFTAFSEFNREAGGDIWFALSPERPLAFFAGIWCPQWTSVRKVKTGQETTDLLAFLTTEPNSEARAIHPKAMPVILTTEEEREAWMQAPWPAASTLQRSLPEGALKIIGRGQKRDDGPGLAGAEGSGVGP